MTNGFTYQSDSYGRESQRFVIPLYYKDSLGNYEFSSTATLLKYKGAHYFAFAAHALSNVLSISDFYIFGSDGEFYAISDIAIGYRVFEDKDIVIVDCFNQVLDGKNYFDISESSMLGFDKKHFAWTGFPSSKCKAKKIHNSKSSETLRNQFVHEEENSLYFKSAQYFTIVSKVRGNNKQFITGIYERKNQSLKYKGNVSMAPSPQGMSGGAMYFFSKGQTLKNNLSETFRFAGIGIEHKKDNTIVGVSRDMIINLIDQFTEEEPVQFSLVDEKVETQA
ncbi:TPA: hypothetical protein NG675_004531 [Vibrio parahaemolyticus]|nr:hypothetical protein [Vibrio parahaemolyticus]HCE2818499.1 hypothetical protein [Vibrio parahaemolyticus]HCG5307098.1 hypothetical protein [Vibrio parahaemolyticus]HCG7534181.1 hypothetical protein [Vibrio parahaemolyticus]HCG8238703.1 hypothetical protein [Vibrio parahaemolyticus]